MSETEQPIATNTSEEAPLLRRVDADLSDDQPVRIPSTASLSSLVDMKVEHLANVPEVMMNTFKSSVGSGILGFYTFIFLINFGL